MKLKLQTSGGFFKTDIADESSVSELKELIQNLTKMKNIKILVGYPPNVLLKDDTAKLQDCNIHTGDTLIIEEQNEVLPKKKVNIGNSSSKPIKAGSVSSIIKEEICLICDEIAMSRVIVPSDNSCLFTCIYFITNNGKLDTTESNNLRKIIAEAIGKDPEKYNSSYLGKNNADYCEWIMNPNSWGGAIELSIFSDYFKMEITCVDIMSGAVIRFGQDKFSLRGILIYDGIHYDPLVIDCDHLRRTIFPAKEDCFLDLAMEIVNEARFSRQFTDVKNFKLRCVVCGINLQGDEEVKSHAAATGHNKFGEI